MKSTKKIKKRFGKYFFETEEDEMMYNIYKKLDLDYDNYIPKLEDELNYLLLIKDTVSFDQYEYDNKLEKLVDK